MSPSPIPSSFLQKSRVPYTDVLVFTWTRSGPNKNSPRQLKKCAASLFRQDKYYMCSIYRLALLGQMLTPIEIFGAILTTISFILVVNLYSSDSVTHTVTVSTPPQQVNVLYNTPATLYNSGFVQWAGIDHSVGLSSPVNDVMALSLDSQSRVFPAAELHGSLYMPEGNIILGSDSNIYLGADISLLGLLSIVAKLQCAVCTKEYPCCPTTATMNLSSCTCVCNDGFSGPACTTDVCANGGNWSDYTQQCVCPYPYTVETRCSQIKCVENSILNSVGVCVCMSPFTGPRCNITTAIPQSVNLSYWNQSAGTPRSNWGVAQCFGSLCVCPPLYQPKSNSVVARQMACLGNAAACSLYFARAAPYCCTGTVRCEETLGSVTCTTQPCCNYKQTPGMCMATLGCMWNQTSGCTLTAIYPHLWSSSLLSCTDNPLCQGTVSQDQAFYYYNSPNRPDVFSTVIQRLAWTQISQYDLWDDGLSHSIVTTTQRQAIMPCETAWRLALVYNNPSVSSTLWTCGYTNNIQTEFILELVDNSSIVPSYLLGAVYRVWAANSLWCLLDRPLYPDEYFLYSFSPITNLSLVAIDLASPLIDAGKDACGLFIIQDGVFDTLHTTSVSIDSTSGTPVLSNTLPPNQITIQTTTPPVNMDWQKLNPTPLPITKCRFLQCQIPMVRGVCSSYSCAEQLLGQHLFAQCLPCLQAHIILDPSL